MTTFILGGYILGLVSFGVGVLAARFWQAIACKMAVDYATSPAPTPASVLAWYSGRVKLNLARRLLDD